MTSILDARMSQPELADRDLATDRSKYHPRCGEEHRHKPTKAIIGIGLLVVLSFLLHELNGRVSTSESNPASQHIAHNAR